MEWQRSNFWISDDVKHLSVSEVVRLHRQVYDCDAYSNETVQRLLGTSLWLGLYNDKQLVGFARAVTDKATLSHLCDIIVDSKFQRQGLGTWLMKCFLKHRDILPTNIGLGTHTADSFFEKFNFERASIMRRDPRPESILPQRTSQ
jgi:GNAT superfamily N-acetyltransferase